MKKNHPAPDTGWAHDVKIRSDLGLEQFQAQPQGEIPGFTSRRQPHAESPFKSMRQQSIVLGAVYTIGAMTAVAVMAAVVKWASHGFSSEFLMAVRWAAGLAVFFAFYAIFSRVSLRSARWPAQAGVAVSWTAAIFLYYVSVRYVPLMDATLLLNTSALFGPLLAVVFDHKREPWRVWGGSAIGFLGVLIVLRPGADVFQPMSLVALVAGLLMALRIYLNSRLADEPKQRTTFYSLAVGLAVCLLLMAATGFHVARPAWQGMLFTPAQVARPLFVDSALLGGVAALGALSLLQPLLVAWSLQYASVGQVAPFRYTAVIVAAAIDWLVWDQVPTWFAVGGMVLIGMGGMLILASPRHTPT